MVRLFVLLYITNKSKRFFPISEGETFSEYREIWEKKDKYFSILFIFQEFSIF
jgi:hypothetical protein